MISNIKRCSFILMFSLLVACTGTATPTDSVAQVEATVAPTATPQPTNTPVPTATDEPTSTPLPTATNTPSPTDTPAPTDTPEPTATPTPLPPSDLVSADNCYLPLANFTGVGLGVPRYEGLLPSVGTVNATVLFVDFEDVPANNKTPEEVFNIISPLSSDFFNQVSYGRMTLNLQPHLTWLRLSRQSAYYGNAIQSYYGHRDFIQEAVNLADSDVDFSTTDTVIVLSNPDVENIRLGPALQSIIPGDGIKADGVEIVNGVTSGADLKHWGGLWLNHELGHNMTLPDLYAYSYDTCLLYTSPSPRDS